MAVLYCFQDGLVCKVHIELLHVAYEAPVRGVGRPAVHQHLASDYKERERDSEG